MIVVIKHQGFFNEPSWTMEINLKSICEAVGNKVETERGGKWVKVDEYPLKNLRKVLKLIFQNCSEDEIENVQRYLNKHNKKCASEFEKICSKGR